MGKGIAFNHVFLLVNVGAICICSRTTFVVYCSIVVLGVCVWMRGNGAGQGKSLYSVLSFSMLGLKCIRFVFVLFPYSCGLPPLGGW